MTIQLLFGMSLGGAGEDRGFRGGDRLRRADMHPQAFKPKPVQPTGFLGASE